MLSSIKDMLWVRPVNSNKEETKINPNAGYELLSHFQQQWVELHELNEINAENAARLAEKIFKIHNRVASDSESCSQILKMLNVAPNIKTMISRCVEQVRELHDSFESVEKGLLDLENLIEDCELEAEKVNHRHELTLFKEKKLANLETARAQLATKHAQNVIEHELKQKKVLQERQQVFQEAFNKDMEVYKNLGSIPKIEIPKAKPSALLEEIQLDLDDKDLDKFLNG